MFHVCLFFAVRTKGECGDKQSYFWIYSLSLLRLPPLDSINISIIFKLKLRPCRSHLFFAEHAVGAHCEKQGNSWCCAREARAVIRRAREARAANHRAFSGPPTSLRSVGGGDRKTPCDSLIPNLKILLTNSNCADSTQKCRQKTFKNRNSGRKILRI